MGSAVPIEGASKNYMRIGALSLCLLVVSTLFDGAGDAASTLRVDAAQSRLVVHVLPKGVLSPALHEHLFAPDHWEGVVSGDADHPEEVQGEIRIRADGLRDRQPALSAGDVAQVEGEVRGPQVLDAAKYPIIRFVVTGLAVDGRDSQSSLHGVLTGSLDLHGTTRVLRIPVRARWSPAQLWVDGSVSFKQSEFGIKPYGRLFGAIAVQDQVTVEFTILAESSH